MPKIATVILARCKYSKRIPKKILTKINGETLIEHTVKHALKLRYPIYVYTDYGDVVRKIKKYNVNIRKKLYDDESGTHRTDEELKKYNEEIQADVLILLQATSPYRNIGKVEKWIEEFVYSKADCGIAAYKLEDGFYYNISGKAYNYKKQYRKYNQKESIKENVYKETGSFYIFKIKQIDKNHITNTNKLMIFEDPYNIDINTIEDLKKIKGYNEN